MSRPALTALACAAAAISILPPAAHAYLRLYFRDSSGITFLHRADNKGIQFYLNSLVAPGFTTAVTGTPVKVVSDNSDPVAAARAALASWNAVGANLQFLPLKATASLHNSKDGQAVISFAATNDDLSFLGFSSPQSPGAVAATASIWYSGSGTLSDGTVIQKGDFADSDILLNPSFAFSTDGSTGYDLQGVITHELGHALGADHSGLVGATMFQNSTVVINGTANANFAQRLLSADERAFAFAAYPVSGKPYGTISGTITTADGSAVQHALVTLADTDAGVMVGGMTGSDGTYAIQVPAGSYVAYAEPLGGIVGQGNIVAFFQDPPATITTGFQPTFATSGGSNTQFRVTAGATTSGASITVSPQTSVLAAPILGLGAAGGTADILSPVSVLVPRTVPSGQAFDIGILGPGIDANTTIQLVGPGISLRPGSVRQDPSVNFLAGPLIRATIDVAARQTPALASIFVSKGSSVVALTGVLLIVPPTPTFVSKGIVSSASGLGLNGDGVVTPGGLVTVYDIPGSPNLGPGTFVQPTQFDPYGKLPTTLAGVTVRFDGQPGPVFLAWNQQLNVQVPFEVAGKKNTVVQVDYFGSTSAPVTVPVAASQPALFTYNGAATAGNQDGKLNTETNAAARGTVISLYGTGLGKLSYDVQTGVGAPAPPPGFTGGNTCTLGGSKSVPVAFAGWTPSAVGLAQWSFVIPADSPVGSVTVACTDPNGASTQPGTIFIK